MTNVECRLTNDGIASLSRLNRQNTLFEVRCSTFDVRRSLVSFH
ncbi:hypothetical protein D1AOALGA4SA_5164 [Olavius algarvensis Delta 1 endosymbiont]|nr:hypothetical protein D1AOALGA4SA_5164 [Olavius algarvensis Delta 1 endosymbiont]